MSLDPLQSPELRQTIFSFLPPSALKNASRVCKDWNDTYNFKPFWVELAHRCLQNPLSWDANELAIVAWENIKRRANGADLKCLSVIKAEQLEKLQNQVLEDDQRIHLLCTAVKNVIENPLDNEEAEVAEKKETSQEKKTPNLTPIIFALGLLENENILGGLPALRGCKKIKYLNKFCKDNPYIKFILGLSAASKIKIINKFTKMKPKKLLKQASDAGLKEAPCILGVTDALMVRALLGVKRKKQTALFIKAADRGNLRACLKVHYYRDDAKEFNYNIDSEKYLKKAAEKGDINCQLELGIFLLENQREDEGVEWIGKAALQGSPKAQIMLGELDHKEIEGIKIWIEKLKNKGFDPIHVELGILFAEKWDTFSIAAKNMINEYKEKRDQAEAFGMVALIYLCGEEMWGEECKELQRDLEKVHKYASKSNPKMKKEIERLTKEIVGSEIVGSEIVGSA